MLKMTFTSTITPPITHLLSHSICCSFLRWHLTCYLIYVLCMSCHSNFLVIYTINATVQHQGFSVLLPWLAIETLVNTRALLLLSWAEAWLTGTHQSVTGINFLSQNWVLPIVLLGLYERISFSSRIVLVHWLKS